MLACVRVWIWVIYPFMETANPVMSWAVLLLVLTKQVENCRSVQVHGLGYFFPHGLWAVGEHDRLGHTLPTWLVFLFGY